MKLLLLSAYEAASHALWRHGLVKALGDHEWQCLSLPPRHFAWRIRGNPLSWWADERLRGPVDCIVATSMVDLATLRGLQPQLAGVPVLLYFHENQFAYPDNRGSHGQLEARMVNLYSALSAQTLAFNSDYNRQSFHDGVAGLLRHLPDCLPTGVVEQLQQRSLVLPVGLAVPVNSPNRRPFHQPLRLAWNHRWEYDKGPDRLLLALRALRRGGIDFRLDLMGQCFRDVPESMTRILEEFDGCLGMRRPLQDRQAYLARLAENDLVLSTALHDFQGLSVLEAVALGVCPLVPDRLAYPQWIPSEFRYRSCSDNPEAEAEALVNRLKQLCARQPELPCLKELSWRQLAPHYQSVLEQLLDAERFRR